VTAAAPRANVLGVGVSAIDIPIAVATLKKWVNEGAREYVCVCGVHGVMESQQDEALRDIHNRAGLVTPDGMPLVWLSRHYGFPRTQRVYGPDLMLATFEDQELRRRRHYFYGGAEGVPELLASRLSARFPGLVVAGTWSPPFRQLTPEEEREIDVRINDTGAEFVWVGLSTPKQERWMSAHRAGLSAAALLGVGAAFDFHAGLKSQAPRWMQRAGLEWLFRMASEPRRLGKRYLVNNPRFVWELIRREVTGSHSELPSV
jgi:N-acetylglucosaminyldiphosphoundecaprenol N-acetyl-beta-D-mannosaminyltransferase